LKNNKIQTNKILFYIVLSRLTQFARQFRDYILPNFEIFTKHIFNVENGCNEQIVNAFIQVKNIAFI